MKIITKANKMLEARGLIKLREHQSEVNVVGITLTLEGYNLGNKYDSPWQWSNLWFIENVRNHWISFIIGFLAGIFGPRLVNWLSKIFG
jgi:DNA-binding HxlR family transcriptional regulator